MARQAQSFAAEMFMPWDTRTQMEVDILRSIIERGVAAEGDADKDRTDKEDTLSGQ
jgi:hypothetical protein